MKKIETTWHYLLWQAIEKKKFCHTQKALAAYFGYSLSTINLAVKKVAAVGAIKMAGKFFTVADPKKLLFYWATHRVWVKDLIYKTWVDLPINEIEGLIPPQAIIAGFSAARKILGEAPADYAKVFFYLPEENLEEVRKRFPPSSAKKPDNVLVLKSYPRQADYGQLTTLPQTLVDLWGMGDWYAKDFVVGLEEKINEFLSCQ